MKVILKQAVPKLGKEGQVVNVKPGYARNFLFPQHMAVLADKSQMKVLDLKNAKVAQQLLETKSAADTLAEKIDGKEITIETKAGADRARLFGAVTSQDIADAIKSQLGETVDKKDVLLLRPIKRLGHYDIELDVHRQVSIAFKLHVVDPDLLEEERAQAAQAAAVEALSNPGKPKDEVAEDAGEEVEASSADDETEEDAS